MKGPATAIAAEAEPIGGLIYTAFWIPSLPCIWRVIAAIDTGFQESPMRHIQQRPAAGIRPLLTFPLPLFSWPDFQLQLWLRQFERPLHRIRRVAGMAEVAGMDRERKTVAVFVVHVRNFGAPQHIGGDH